MRACGIHDYLFLVVYNGRKAMFEIAQLIRPPLQLIRSNQSKRYTEKGVALMAQKIGIPRVI